MRAMMINGLAIASLFAFSGIAAAACFEGHNHRMASETPKSDESVTLSTHDGQVKLPAETAGESSAPVKPVETAQ